MEQEHQMKRYRTNAQCVHNHFEVALELFEFA